MKEARATVLAAEKRDRDAAAAAEQKASGEKPLLTAGAEMVTEAATTVVEAATGAAAAVVEATTKQPWGSSFKSFFGSSDSSAGEQTNKEGGTSASVEGTSASVKETAIDDDIDLDVAEDDELSQKQFVSFMLERSERTADSRKKQQTHRADGISLSTWFSRFSAMHFSSETFRARVLAVSGIVQPGLGDKTLDAKCHDEFKETEERVSPGWYLTRLEDDWILDGKMFKDMWSKLTEDFKVINSSPDATADSDKRLHSTNWTESVTANFQSEKFGSNQTNESKQTQLEDVLGVQFGCTWLEGEISNTYGKTENKVGKDKKVMVKAKQVDVTLYKHTPVRETKGISELEHDQYAADMAMVTWSPYPTGFLANIPFCGDKGMIKPEDVKPGSRVKAQFRAKGEYLNVTVVDLDLKKGEYLVEYQDKVDEVGVPTSELRRDRSSDAKVPDFVPVSAELVKEGTKIQRRKTDVGQELIVLRQTERKQRRNEEKKEEKIFCVQRTIVGWKLTSVNGTPVTKLGDVFDAINAKKVPTVGRMIKKVENTFGFSKDFAYVYFQAFEDPDILDTKLSILKFLFNTSSFRRFRIPPIVTALLETAVASLESSFKYCIQLMATMIIFWPFFYSMRGDLGAQTWVDLTMNHDSSQFCNKQYWMPWDAILAALSSLVMYGALALVWLSADAL